MGFYSKAKQGLTDAGLDLLDLAKGFERSYEDQNLTGIRDAASNYLDTQHAGTVLTAAPLVGGIAAGMGVGTTGLAAMGLGSVAAAPFAGRLFYRGEMSDLMDEEANIRKEIDAIEGQLKARPSSADEASSYARSLSEEQVRELGQRKTYLEDNALPAARRSQEPIRGKRRAVGGAATAAALTLAALLSRNDEAQEPTPFGGNPSAPNQQQPYAPQGPGGLLNVNADFSNGPMSVVPPVNQNLLSY